MTTLALIPARAGSKRIPRKNLADLGGLPLIAHSIRWARAEPGIDRVLVSTDSEEIAAVALRFGAEVPFLRPAEMAADETPDLDVFVHALDWLETVEGRLPEFIVQTRPTAPFRERGLFRKVLDAYRAVPGATHARTIRRAEVPAFKTYFRDPGGTIRPVVTLPGRPEAHNLPAQQLPSTWIHDGVLDLVVPAVIRAGSMTGATIVGVEHEARDAVDIDEPRDLEAARGIASRRRKSDARRRAAATQLLVCDVDGTLTDGAVWYGEAGEAYKRFSLRDGMGIERLRDSGVEVAFLTRESTGFTAARARKLGVAHVIAGCHDKEAALRSLAQRLGLTFESIGYVGDDVNDAETMSLAGFCACPRDAEPPIVALAHFVAERDGGHGAVREVAEFIIAARETGVAEPG
jgi:YrbI family 3-deoxy-D-manno-octulosonate 8-phosphate phosphatase